MSNTGAYQPNAKEVDPESEFYFLSRLPAPVRRFLTEESPIDFSAADVFYALDDRGTEFLLSRLRSEAMRQLDDEIEEQRRRWPDTQWPRATLGRIQPIRRATRKAAVR